MPYSYTTHGDLGVTTLRDLDPFKWESLAFGLQSYPYFTELIDKNKSVLESGTSMQWNVQLSDNGGARAVDLGEPDIVNWKDTMTVANENMRNVTNSWGIDTRILSANMGKARIVDLRDTQRVACWASLVNAIETFAWSLPNASVTKNPIPIWYYIVYSASEGFNGGNPSGYSSCAGINSTTNAGWRNYTGQYTNPSTSDLLEKARRGAELCYFQSPIPYPSYIPQAKQNYGWYTTLPVSIALSNALASQNQNIGDLAMYDGRTLFKGAPIHWVPYLNDNASTLKDPFFGICWPSFRHSFKQGEDFLEMERDSPAQHRSIEFHVDVTYGLKCYSRRRNMVFCTGTPS